MNPIATDRSVQLTRRSAMLGSALFGSALLTSFGLAAGASSPARAAPYKPNRPVEIIVGTDPGSGFDRTGRLLQKIWQTSHLVDRTVTVLNKPGGGGATGWDYMNLHPGTGTYVAIVSPLLLTTQITGNMAMSFHDVTPVGLLEDEEIVTAVGTASSIKDGTDLMNRLKADPKSVSIGLSGIGGQNHIAIALACEAFGGIDVAKLKIVGFEGSGDVATAVIGGHVECTVSPASTVAPQVAAGRMRAIAVSSDKRMTGTLAEVPTWREQHVDSVFANWRGLVGPKAMTPDQIAYWNGVLAKTVQAPDWQADFKRQQLTDHYLDSAAMGRFLAAQNTQLTAIMSKLGLAQA